MNPDQQVTLVRANNEREEYPDVEFCCDNNENTYIVDPRRSSFKGIMNLIRPHMYLNAHNWHRMSEEQVKDVDQYYAEQCTRLGDALDESTRFGHTDPYEI